MQGMDTLKVAKTRAFVPAGALETALPARVVCMEEIAVVSAALGQNCPSLEIRGE